MYQRRLHIEAERIKSDFLFLEQFAELPNDELRDRLMGYRQLNILILS